MKPTHTPGPWTFIESDDARIPDRIIGANGAPVVSGSIVRRDDAALIAACPTILDALRDCVARLESLDKRLLELTGSQANGDLGEVTRARAAIAKATGSQP
jgi:hypothetical protein